MDYVSWKLLNLKNKLRKLLLEATPKIAGSSLESCPVCHMTFLKHPHPEHRNCGSNGVHFVLQMQKLWIKTCLKHWAAIIINNTAAGGRNKSRENLILW